MGAEMSTAPCAESCNDKNRPSMKPNKVKKNNYFHSKPSKLVDLIVNKDWQSVLNRCTSHPREIYVTSKVRLYGVDRKILPLHIACAMRPPEEILSVLLTPDQITSMSTVKTPMVNVKKKTMRRSDKKGKNVEAVPTMSYPQQLILGLEESVSATDLESKDNVSPTTCKTAPLSPSHILEDIQSTAHSFSQDGDDPTSDDVFFSDAGKENLNYALQITPSGEVKQISPHGKSQKSKIATESPFVHASAQSDDQPSFQSAMADDFLPIHIACLFRSSPEVIKLLIRCYPEGLEKKNKWGMLPIHIVCSNISLDPPSITASKLVDNSSTKEYLNNLYSDSMDKKEKWEVVKIVDMLVTASPQCVNTPSDNIEWYTPLEYAARNFSRGDTKDEVLRVLKRKKECSVGNISCDGHSISSSLSDSKASSDLKVFPISNSPLLYNYISIKDWQRAEDRVATKPDEASFWVVDTDYPRLPIHLACSNADVSRDLIEALLNTYPEGCMAKEGSGSNPLHLACKNGLPIESITTLVEKYPKATRIKDHIGRLPLHLACANGIELAGINLLMDAYPDSCSMKDYNGHTALTYVDYCTDDEAVKDECTSLFEKYEAILSSSVVKEQNQKTIEEEGEYHQLHID